MKTMRDLLIVALLLAALLIVAPAALDAVATVSDRQGLTLNLQQQQQLQQQVQPQVIIVTGQEGSDPGAVYEPPTAAATPETAVTNSPASNQQPTATATAHPLQLTAERAAACQAARDAGRRMPNYCVATPAAANNAGWGR